MDTFSKQEPVTALDHKVENNYAFERLLVGFRAQKSTVGGSMYLSIFFGLWCYLRSSHVFFLWWIALFTAYNLFRLWISRTIINPDMIAQKRNEYHKWDFVFKIVVSGAALFWAALGCFVLTQPDSVIATGSLLAIVGVAATGVISYPGNRFIAFFWVAMCLVPPGIFFFLGPYKEYAILDAFIAMFILTVALASGHHFKMITDIFREKERNAELTQELQVTITQLKKSHDEINTLQEKQLHSSKFVALGEMASGVAHEINNPLAVIKGKAEQLRYLMEQGKGSPELISKSLDSIVMTSDRISKIVNSLRVFSTGGDGESTHRFSVQSLVHDTFDLCRERYKFHQIRLTENLPSESVYLSGRRSQLQQVLINLLNNSFDAILTLDDRWIDITVTAVGDQMQMMITDSGPGIPEDVAKKLMQPFFTTKEIGKGAGLGLSTSVGILKSHQGDIYYDPHCKNTRFILQLPISKSDQNPQAA